MRSFAQTVHYTVWHTADQIGSRGGWLGHFECRVRTGEISFADVRISPAARLMKRWPVFVTAGGCSPELPLFVYRSGEEALFRELLPEFRMPPDLLARTQERSLIFFAPAGIPFALCLLLTLVSATVLPQLTVTLLIPTFFFGAHLCVSPGCLPDRSTKPLGCQRGPHQPDPDLSRLGKAQGEERAAAGCGEIFQIYGNELNLSAADRRQLSQSGEPLA